jgi:hypothetical protein
METYHLPHLLESNQPSHDWRPQARKQKEAAGSPKQVLCEGNRLRRFSGKIGDSEGDQRDAKATAE